MLKYLLCCALMATALACSGATGAFAEVIAESGQWRAFHHDGSCIIGTGSDNSFALLYFSQQDAFALDVMA